MSGIAGLYNLDGSPVDAVLLERMTECIADKCPDGSGHWTSGPVGFGHGMLHTTPESLIEKQPLSDETGLLCVTLDGRVDNRKELREAVESNGCRLRDDTDAELVLRAYQCWGVGCPVKICGDFAFALWDGTNQQLLCARDVIGIKPFYYYFDGCRFMFASELHQILQNRAIPRRPNKGMIAEYLAADQRNLQETLYEGIFLLPRAHQLILRGGHLRLECYWTFGCGAEIRYPKDDDYAENFFEIFKEAVACRLRSHRMIAAELSGGLDSSSIVSMAESLRRQGTVKQADFETFSIHFPGETYDESQFAKEVVRKWDLKSYFVDEEPMQSAPFLTVIRRFQDLPDFPSRRMFDRQMALIQKNNCRVVLNGVGGDEWLCGSLHHTADLIGRFQLFRAIQRSWADCRMVLDSDSTKSFAATFLRYGLWPLMPGFARQRIKTALRRNGTSTPAWVGSQFALSTRLIERLENTGAPVDGFTSLAGKDIVRRLNFPWYWLESRYLSEFNLEYRYPFLDRRLIEYCLALPHEQLRRGQETKYVLRQAMKGVLPESIRKRNKIRSGPHSFWNAMQSLGGKEFVDSLVISSEGWVNREIVRGMYENLLSHTNRHDSYSAQFLFPLWLIFAVELWFRATFVNGTAIRGNY